MKKVNHRLSISLTFNTYTELQSYPKILNRAPLFYFFIFQLAKIKEDVKWHKWAGRRTSKEFDVSKQLLNIFPEPYTSARKQARFRLSSENLPAIHFPELSSNVKGSIFNEWL